MALTKQGIEKKSDKWSIPLLVRAAITFFALSGCIIFILSLRSQQETLFGLPASLVTGASLALVIFFVPIVVSFWFFPHSALALFLYWLIRFFRQQICVFALLGVVYLITIHADFFSLRGVIPALNLIVLFILALFVEPISSDRLPIRWMNSFSMLLRKLTDRINSLPVRFLSIVVALLPVAIICAYIYWGLNASLRNYGPYSTWEDETAYWLRIRSFSHVGLNAGYNVPNELTAPATFSRYGEGSPLDIYLYGSIARVTGWFSYLPILINFALLTVGILLFISFTKPDPVQLIFTGFIILLTRPILLYLPMTTHETLNQAIAFALAIIFVSFLMKREQLSPAIRVGFVILVFIATLVRLSWGLLLVPAIFYSLNGKVFPRIFLAVLVGLGLYVSASLMTSYLVPPVNNSIFMTLQDSLTRGPQVLIARIIDQFTQLFRSRKLDENIAAMFQIAVIIGWNMIRLARLIKSKLSAVAILQSRIVFEIYNVATLALAGLVFYIQSGFGRTFAPSILVVYLLQTVRKDYRFLATLLTLNAVFFCAYVITGTGASSITQADFGTEFPQRASLQTKFEKWIVFDPATQNPWCNTLLIPLKYYDYRLTVVPPGIGISFITDDETIGFVTNGITIKTPLKSKYFLFDQGTLDSFGGEINVRLLETSSFGDLYYNLDSDCEFNQ